TCAMTSALRARCLSRPSLAPRPPARRAEAIPRPVYRSTGTPPKNSADATETAAVKIRTVASIWISCRRGSAAGAKAASSRRPAHAKGTPSAPPAPPRREAAPRQGHAQRAPGHAEQEALQQQRARDAEGARAQRRARGELVLPALGPGKRRGCRCTAAGHSA